MESRLAVRRESSRLFGVLRRADKWRKESEQRRIGECSISSGGDWTSV